MADSYITKRALAEALKELLKAEPFAQVSVGEICEKCHMNRKSFYYHFKDKYDLVNWIYSTEFIAVAKERGYSDVNMDLLADMCVYFYDNRDFYPARFHSRRPELVYRLFQRYNHFNSVTGRRKAIRR